MAAFEPRLPTSADYKPKDGDLVVGDPHGDLEGLHNVLRAAGYNPQKQRLITVGDNIDKGHDSKGVMDFLDHEGALTTMANHEWKHVRNQKHMLAEALTGKKNPIKVTPELTDTMKQLGSDYHRYVNKMSNYPLYLPFEDSQGPGNIVHGGVDGTRPMDRQSRDMMLVRRLHPTPAKPQMEESPEFPLWQRSYNGEHGTILQGHHPMSHAQDWHGNKNVYNLDGGGALGSHVPWGGVHRAIRLGDRKVFEAPGSEVRFTLC